MLSTWTNAETVRRLSEAPPNERLVRFAANELAARGGAARALDVGCGTARNTVPLARLGWEMVGIDASRPMLEAAAGVITNGTSGRVQLVAASMDSLPLPSAAFDLVIAHGIWNLAQSDEEFRMAIRESSRALKPGGALFVATFSRQTLPLHACATPRNRFTFNDFAATPQCFVTERELLEELDIVGMVPDPAVPLVEHNRPLPGRLRVRSAPVIYEGGFRKLANR